MPVTALTSGGDTVDRTVYTTASVSPTAGEQVVVAIGSGGADAANVPSLSGCGLTWSLAAPAVSGGFAGAPTLTVYVGSGSPSPGTLTITFTTAAQNCAWSVFSVPDVDAITQWVAASAAGNTGLVTTGTPDHPLNLVLGFFHGRGAGGSAWSVGGGFSTIHNVTIGSPNCVLLTEVRVIGADTTVEATGTSLNGWAGLAVELNTVRPPLLPATATTYAEGRAPLSPVAPTAQTYAEGREPPSPVAPTAVTYAEGIALQDFIAIPFSCAITVGLTSMTVFTTTAVPVSWEPPTATTYAEGFAVSFPAPVVEEPIPVTYTFSPPTVLMPSVLPDTKGPARSLFQHINVAVGVSVLKENGVYSNVPNPDSNRVDAAQAVYLGGHVYLVSEEVAAELTAAGYTVL